LCARFCAKPTEVLRFVSTTMLGSYIFFLFHELLFPPPKKINKNKIIRLLPVSGCVSDVAGAHSLTRSQYMEGLSSFLVVFFFFFSSRPNQPFVIFVSFHR
jgi:hypothetical protein